MAVVEYTLGSMYAIYGKQYRFIKSTHTGYNFLNIQTNKCLLRQAMYPIKPTASWINNQCKKDIELGKLIFVVPGCRVDIFRKLEN